MYIHRHLIHMYPTMFLLLELGEKRASNGLFLKIIVGFMSQISERIAVLSKGQDGWQLTTWKVVEYALIKTPLVTTVLSSFLFSFTRIIGEFRFKAIFYFVYPFLVYVVLFHRRLFTLVHIRENAYQNFLYNWKIKLHHCTAIVEEYFSRSLFLQPPSHWCSDNKFRNHQEAALLLDDFDVRSKTCIFMGLFTAYFAVFMPRAFIPERTSAGDLQHMLVDDLWVTQLFFIVALTGFSLYVTYLFPIQYFDLLYRCAVHMGYWERIQPTKRDEEIAVEYDINRSIYELHGKIVVHKGQYFQAQAHSEWTSVKSVAAEPGNADHLKIFRIARDPVLLVTYMCVFQGALVAAQFWMLMLTTDWQHIMTLVLLMFANYLLLAKMFKDRVVIGRIYKPSIEDLQLLKQLQQETLRT